MLGAGISELTIVQWLSFFTEIGFGVDKWIGDLIGPCLFAIFMGIGRVFYAFIGNKVKAEKSIMLSSALCFVCYITVAFSNNTVLSLIFCAICGFAVSNMWPVVLSLSAENFKGIGSSLYSILALFGDLGCAVGPWVLGLISDLSVSNRTAQNFAYSFGLTGGLPGIQLGFLIISVVPLLMFLSLRYLNPRVKK